MTLNTVRAALRNALSSVPPPSAPDYALRLMLHQANEGHEQADHRIVNLITCLRDEPFLTLFDGLMQVVAGNAARVDYAFLAGWLIRRAEQANVDGAVDDLQRYVDADQLEFRMTAAVSGLKLGEPCALA